MSAILVAVDLSESTPSTIEFASQIAAGKGVRLDLVHVLVSVIPAHIKVHSPSNIRQKMVTGERDTAKRALLGLMETWVPKDIRGECILADGEPAQTICDQASQGYEMVVVSTRGRTGLGHVMLGSVAERVVRRATVPVLVVR